MGKSGAVTVEGVDYFLTVQTPSPRLTLIGAVHISQALAPIARIAGLDVTIIDPRTAFATPERFPDTPVIAQWPDEALAAAPLDRYTAICLLTHDPKIDDPALMIALRAELLLHRRARLEEDARQAARTHAGARLRRRSARAHPRADRPRHRRRQPGRDRGFDHGRDHRLAAQEAPALRKRLAMKFGALPIGEAEGAILAHAVRIDGVALKKGDVVTPERLRMLTQAGVTSVVAAQLEEGDVGEDEAALRLAERLAGEHVRCAPPFTGRVNLFAEAAGLAVIDRAAIDRLNAIDEAITVASLPSHRPVEDGDMVATVKIIPFSTRGETLEAALAAIGLAARCRSRRSGRCGSPSPRPCCRGSRKASSPRRCARSRRASPRPARASSPM